MKKEESFNKHLDQCSTIVKLVRDMTFNSDQHMVILGSKTFNIGSSRAGKTVIEIKC